MVGDAALAGKLASKLLERGVYAVGFSYPVRAAPNVSLGVLAAPSVGSLAVRWTLTDACACPLPRTQVVPKGAARVRVQISAAHSRAQLDAAVAAFKAAGQELGITRP